MMVWKQLKKCIEVGVNLAIEVKLMVISIASGTFIKNAGEFSEKLGNTDVNNKLVKFNGLEYQCNDASYELLYMEV